MTASLLLILKVLLNAR